MSVQIQTKVTFAEYIILDKLMAKEHMTTYEFLQVVVRKEMKELVKKHGLKEKDVGETRVREMRKSQPVTIRELMREGSK